MPHGMKNGFSSVQALSKMPSIILWHGILSLKAIFSALPKKSLLTEQLLMIRVINDSSMDRFDAIHAVNAFLTRPEITAGSARPVVLSFTAFITRPMSFMPCASSCVMMVEMI